MDSGISLYLLSFLIGLSACKDLTLVAEEKGSAVVYACIAKLEAASQIFPRDDQQLIKRIAYVESNYGQEPFTYSGSNNNGGIWQLTENKYLETIKNTSTQIIQEINEFFNINWNSTSWVDLRKPFYSALAARLYLELLVPENEGDFPFSTDLSQQNELWREKYTNKTEATDYVNAVNVLIKSEGTCNIGRMDLIYLLDESGSVGFSNFVSSKEFISNITKHFTVASDRVRIGLITFASVAKTHFFLNTYNTSQDILTAINGVPYTRGRTNTSGALDTARIEGFIIANGARPAERGVPRVAIVITDGISTEPNKTVLAAEELRDSGVIIYAVGIANYNEEELNTIAGDTRFVLKISSFSEALLNAFQESISLSACQASQGNDFDEVIITDIIQNTTLYVNYPFLPTDGVTIKLNSTSNNIITLYGSVLVATPNEALYDVALTTDSFQEEYLTMADITSPNQDTASLIYLAVQGSNAADLSSDVQITVSAGGTENTNTSSTCVEVDCINGNCINNSCSCNTGWTGVNCTEAINNTTPCVEADCINGNCINSSCSCNTGWTGVSCTEAIDGTTCIEADCINGNCINNSCSCNAGWTGVNCTEAINNTTPCVEVDCINGNCINNSCSCNTGWTGDNCNEVIVVQVTIQVIEILKVIIIASVTGFVLLAGMCCFSILIGWFVSKRNNQKNQIHVVVVNAPSSGIDDAVTEVLPEVCAWESTRARSQCRINCNDVYDYCETEC